MNSSPKKPGLAAAGVVLTMALTVAMVPAVAGEVSLFGNADQPSPGCVAAVLKVPSSVVPRPVALSRRLGDPCRQEGDEPCPWPATKPRRMVFSVTARGSRNWSK